ncbi:MAG TPA: alpha/beta fold hydrolase [Kiritimatiellia bacterium]|nr:alpha/beta fold hydrolase [Kiritimatiellia bacterium]HRZ12190.1 alpha/beta fold hydrolase [Kiritimatiellia bacterium]HSA18052.1 alpha/beta fold hydrolase [Kiritimatiellia bacterium]
MAGPSPERRRRALHYALVVPLRVALLVLAGLVIMFAAFQRRYIYYPMRGDPAAFAAAAGRAGLAAWSDARGRTIGWRTRRSLLAPPQCRAVVFHGNAGFALHRLYFVDGLSAAGEGLDWEVLLFEYPGYGAREGTPSESAIQAAAEEAVQSLLAENDKPLFLVGESLGCGVAAHLAARFPARIAGLFLVTPFTRLADIAAHHYPFLPVRWLLREKYDAASDLARFAGPVAVLLAGRDEVIPPRLGRALFDGYAGPKRLWVQEEAGHNSLDYEPGAGWWREVANFLVESVAPPALPDAAAGTTNSFTGVK